MAHIADEIVSYEHDAPLQYRSVEAVREVCRRGLAWVAGAVGWDVPDLTVIARGDMGVAWGLNRMTAEAPDGQVVEGWSRGTRVFQRMGDEWMMIHQHVSYPYDAETGHAITDLRPSQERPARVRAFADEAQLADQG
jgi:ketosteroid isomerase-like protein